MLDRSLRMIASMAAATGNAAAQNGRLMRSAENFGNQKGAGVGKVDSEDSWILFVIGVALAAFVAWRFSAYLGLDTATGGLVLARLAVLVVVTGLSWKVADEFPPLGPRAVWPLLLSLLWLCWWPALDYWAVKDLPSVVAPEEMLPWWDSWYTKWGVLVGVAVLGYLVKKIPRRY
jgi:hypothetical protein